MNKISESYAIPRYVGFEDVFEPLIRRITGAQQGTVIGACEFDNDQIKIKPHYFGPCQCQYGVEYKAFCKKNTHTLDCFNYYVQEINEAFKKHPKYSFALPLRTERINMLKALCLKNNFPFKGEKEVEKICTCGFTKSWEMLGHKHHEDCPIVSPNFWHKPTDLKIWWYKVFFRNSYSNRLITIPDLKAIVASVLPSITPQT